MICVVPSRVFTSGGNFGGRPPGAKGPAGLRRLYFWVFSGVNWRCKVSSSSARRGLSESDRGVTKVYEDNDRDRETHPPAAALLSSSHSLNTSPSTAPNKASRL